MSYTTMYRLGEECREIDEFKNAHRGAMYVWNQIAKDYFGLEMFPFMDLYMQKKIWNAQNEKPIKDYEYIVLAASMDKATVKATPEGVKALIEAFWDYGQAHPNSSYTEQSEALSIANFDFKESDHIAWCQTSCGEFWAEDEWCEEKEEYYFYNPNDGDRHFDVIKEFNSWKDEKAQK